MKQLHINEHNWFYIVKKSIGLPVRIILFSTEIILLPLKAAGRGPTNFHLLAPSISISVVFSSPVTKYT